MSAETPIILYVDDERPNRVVFEQGFKNDFRVQTVESGEAALEVFETIAVAVLVTDQRMRDMSGNELLMRAKELYPETIRIVVTAYSDLEPILQAVNDGLVARYIVKPWDRQELFRILAWGMEAYLIGQRDSAIQLRLLETERLATLGSIVAAVAHDLSQPLSYVLTNAQHLKHCAQATESFRMLTEKYGAELQSDDRRKLVKLAAELPLMADDLVRGAKVMAELVDNLRLLSKREPTDSGVDAEPVPIIRYAVAVCSRIVLSCKGSVEYDGPTELPQVTMGDTALTQVLINLIANGAQAIERRSRVGGRVVVTARIAGPTVSFAIIDDGPGMSEEVLARADEPFYSTRKGGTGLGLGQCRRLIEIAGGSLELESAPGRGTTATFSIPINVR